MKTAKIFVLFATAAALLVLPLARLAAEEAWEKSADMMYQHGWYVETAQRDFEGAIAVYQKLIDKFGADKATCAKALLRIGVCYDGLGKKDDAKSAYEKVIANYPDQKDAVSEARLRMAGVSGNNLTPGEKIENLKKAVEELFGKPQNPFASGTLNPPQPFAFAEAAPQEAADYLHNKLVEMGKKFGPELAKGNLPKEQNVYQPGLLLTCLKALAWCDTEKGREDLLDLLKRSNNPEGQFLGKDTEQLIYDSFAFLRPAHVTDGLVEMVVNHIKAIDFRERGPVRSGWSPFVYPGNTVVTSGYQTLAVFAKSNANAMKYMKAEATNGKDEQRARAAIFFLTIVRKPEVAALYTEIATGKYAEETRRMAIVCLGVLGAPMRQIKNYPAWTTAGWWNPDATYALSRVYRADFDMGFALYSPPGGAFPPSETAFANPPKELLDPCLKGLKAAFEANNSVAMRGTVIMSLVSLGRDAAKAPLLEYAKTAIDTQNREMALIGLRVLFTGAPDKKEVADSVREIMNSDNSLEVRVQAAWTLGGLTAKQPSQYAVVTTAPREAIPVILKGLEATRQGWGPMAMGVTTENALNVLHSSTMHGVLLKQLSNPEQNAQQVAVALDEFLAWWKNNKDKTDGEWAAQGIDEWVKSGRKFIESKDATVESSPMSTMAISQYIAPLIETVIGKPGFPMRADNYADYTREQVKMVCDWWDKNKDKVTWNSEKRYFEVKAGAE